MPSISEYGSGTQTQWQLPPHVGSVTVTINGSPATIASQTPTQVTLSAPPSPLDYIVITYSTSAGQSLSSTTLIQDATGKTIQVMSPGASTAVSIGVSTLRVAFPAGSQVVRLAANQRCFFAFGSSTVNATGSDALFPVGAELFAVPFGATHVAVIQDGAVTGAMSVTRMV